MLSAAAILIAALALTVVLIERRRYRIQRRWIEDRRRLEAYDEHLVAANGHPHTGQIGWVARKVDGYDHPEPPEVAA